MTDAHALPPELLALHARWGVAGRPPQPPTAWRPHRWTPWFPEHAEYLNALPNPINRTDVAAQFAGADFDEDTAVQAFLAAMVWGYGRIGYGPYRSARVLASVDRAGFHLLETLRISRDAGGMAGFAYLAQNRLKGFGVAFATKYLYFCVSDAETAVPAPIMDSIVCNWLATFAGWRPQTDWVEADYQRYCDQVRSWSTQLEELPGTIEYLVFASGAGIASGWTDHQLGASGADGRGMHRLGVAGVLEALAVAVEAYEALPNPDSADGDAFRDGVRELQRIVLARAPKDDAQPPGA
jgi:hypothetical protein